MASRRVTRFSRREVLTALIATGGALSLSSLLSACGGGTAYKTPALPDQTPTNALPASYTDSTDALWDVLLPAELDANGVIVSPGAREAGVDSVLTGQNLVRVAIEQGLIPSLPDSVVSLFDDFQTGARQLLNRELDALSTLERPLATLSSLAAEARSRVVARAFDDDRLSGPLLAARAACFLAFLGAITSDAGLVAVGYPPFEDFANGLACSGYPRMTNGQPDDYTYNLSPAATAGDDLGAVIDADGNLR